MLGDGIWEGLRVHRGHIAFLEARLDRLYEGAKALDSLADVYGACESFVTGTFAGVAPVTAVDGRTIGEGTRGPLTKRLQSLYIDLVERECAG